MQLLCRHYFILFHIYLTCATKLIINPEYQPSCETATNRVMLCGFNAVVSRYYISDIYLFVMEKFV